MVAEDMHALLNTIPTHRVRLAGPSTGKRWRIRLEVRERAMVMDYLRRILSVTTIKTQTISLLGQLEGLGPG